MFFLIALSRKMSDVIRLSTKKEHMSKTAKPKNKLP